MINIPLLRRIQKAIDKNPELFEMLSWQTETECGTAYCIAGWALVLNGLKPPELAGTGPFGYVIREAGRLLGLDDQGQTSLLFIERMWPGQFQRKYASDSINGRHETRKSGEHAKLGIARIEHFIQTNGKE